MNLEDIKKPGNASCGIDLLFDTCLTFFCFLTLGFGVVGTSSRFLLALEAIIWLTLAENSGGSEGSRLTNGRAW